jgi:hypothetical protein
MKPLSLNQARERVGAILFGSTWIRSLNDNEAALRSEHLRPRDVRSWEGPEWLACYMPSRVHRAMR